MQTLLKVCLGFGLLAACGQASEPTVSPAAAVARQAAPQTSAPAALPPSPQAGLISPNLGGCGDSDDNSGGLIHVNLGGGSYCCYGNNWGCGGRWGGRGGHR